jgi:hypothetical protein
LDAKDETGSEYSEEFVMSAVYEFLFASDVLSAGFAHVLLDIAARLEIKYYINYITLK